MSSAPLSFYFDLGSPLAYLAAERVLHVLPGPAPWCPVLASELEGAERFDAYRALGYSSARTALDAAIGPDGNPVAPPWQPLDVGLNSTVDIREPGGSRHDVHV